MPKEVITLHLGQAGCQVGQKVWELFCCEHGITKDGRMADGGELEDNTYESFFNATSEGQHVPRAVFADTDPRSREAILHTDGMYKGLFHPDNVMGWKQDCKNNFFEGINMASTMHIADDIMDRVRLQVDGCSNLQGFFVFHAWGGGTGTGIGTKVLEQLRDQFGKKMVFQPAIFPSHHLSSCIVEPYNFIFAMHSMKDLVDLTMPIDNQKAYEMCWQNLGIRNPDFSHLNNLIAQFVSACTSSLRYPTELNATLDEIAGSLVPFPEFRYPVLSLAPLRSAKTAKHENFSVAEIVTDLFEERNILCDCGKILNSNRYMAAVVLLRGTQTFEPDKERDPGASGSLGKNKGPIPIREAMQALSALVQPKGAHRSPIQFHPAMRAAAAFKVGIVAKPPTIPPGFEGCVAKSERFGAMLGNNTAVRQLFVRQYTKFLHLFFHKAYVWQFIEANGEEDLFYEARETVRGIINGYEDVLKQCVEQENSESDRQQVKLMGETERLGQR